jgi:hypothetical protein
VRLVSYAIHTSKDGNKGARPESVLDLAPGHIRGQQLGSCHHAVRPPRNPRQLFLNRAHFCSHWL